MDNIPKWKTKKYRIVGYIGLGLFLLVIAVDIALALIPSLPTLSSYVTHRWTAQPLFGYIVIAMLVFLGVHWFYGKKK